MRRLRDHRSLGCGGGIGAAVAVEESYEVASVESVHNTRHFVPQVVFCLLTCRDILAGAEPG